MEKESVFDKHLLFYISMLRYILLWDVHTYLYYRQRPDRIFKTLANLFLMLEVHTVTLIVKCSMPFCQSIVNFRNTSTYGYHDTFAKSMGTFISQQCLALQKKSLFRIYTHCTEMLYQLLSYRNKCLICLA